MSNKSSSNFTNVVAFFGILFIGFILWMPVNENKVQQDVNNMSPAVQSFYKDCPKINQNIKESGGVVRYWNNQRKEKRLQQQQDRYYSRRRN